MPCLAGGMSEPMLEIVHRLRLLAESTRLSAESNFSGICEMLGTFSKDELVQDPDLAMDLANALYRCDRLEESRVLLQGLADACRHRKTDKVYRRWVNLGGVLCVEFGDMQAAEAAFEETLFCASEANDLSMAAAATFNMGSLAWVRCEWARALTCFQRARTTYGVLGSTYSLAGCHLNIAMTCREMELFREAESHFEHALEGYSGDNVSRTSEISGLEAERALLVCRTSGPESAEVLVRRSIARIADSNYLRTQGEAYRVLGIVLKLQARNDEALGWLRRALELAVTVRNPLLEAEVLEELALLSAGEEEAALGRALRIYSDLGAQARADAVVARFKQRRS